MLKVCLVLFVISASTCCIGYDKQLINVGQGAILMQFECLGRHLSIPEVL